MPVRSRLIVAAATLLAATALSAQQSHTLLATPQTIVWGNYNGQAKPALTVKSGDTVVIQTLSTCGPSARLMANGVDRKDIPSYVDDIYKDFPAAEKGQAGIF